MINKNTILTLIAVATFCIAAGWAWKVWEMRNETETEYHHETDSLAESKQSLATLDSAYNHLVDLMHQQDSGRIGYERFRDSLHARRIGLLRTIRAEQARLDSVALSRTRQQADSGGNRFGIAL